MIGKIQNDGTKRLKYSIDGKFCNKNKTHLYICLKLVMSGNSEHEQDKIERNKS